MIKKPFDCVEFKNTIQVKLLQEYQGMNKDEALRHFNRKLTSSQTPVAKLWKLLQEKQLLKKAG